jgi:hypothetical protein
MRVLVACETSGIVRQAFRSRGHDAWSCDILPSEDESDFHIQGDALAVIGDGWDLMIAHPPCTRLSNSGVRWLDERNLWADMEEACAFFLAMLHAPIPRIAIENPIQHGHARERIVYEPQQIIQPWMFGHGETKATCLWLKGLPPLLATKKVDGREARVHRMPPSTDRWKERSRTLPGIAEAMAQQWSDYTDLVTA